MHTLILNLEPWFCNKFRNPSSEKLMEGLRLLLTFGPHDERRRLIAIYSSVQPSNTATVRFLRQADAVFNSLCDFSSGDSVSL
jgi:hypothetical protein